MRASLVAQLAKNLPAMQETQIRVFGREDTWKRKWQPTLLFLPGESHGQRSLEGYSPWCCKSQTWLSNWPSIETWEGRSPIILSSWKNSQTYFTTVLFLPHYPYFPINTWQNCILQTHFRKRYVITVVLQIGWWVETPKDISDHVVEMLIQCFTLSLVET